MWFLEITLLYIVFFECFTQVKLDTFYMFVDNFEFSAELVFLSNFKQIALLFVDDSQYLMATKLSLSFSAQLLLFHRPFSVFHELFAYKTENLLFTFLSI